MSDWVGTAIFTGYENRASQTIYSSYETAEYRVLKKRGFYRLWKPRKSDHLFVL